MELSRERESSAGREPSAEHEPSVERGSSAWALVALLALLACFAAGTWWWALASRAPASPSHAPPAEDEAEIVRGNRREAVYRLEPEKLVPAAAGVEARWSRLNSEAITALEAGDLARAVLLLEQCRAAVPSEPVFAANLAEALARLSHSEWESSSPADRVRSIERLARAAELAPQREDIARRLTQVRRLSESEADMRTDASEHFEVAYDGARSDLLFSTSQITHALEGAYQDFGELFGFWPVEKGRPKIRVVLYRKTGFHEATGMGHWAAGLFDGAIRVPVEDLGKEKADLERVLRHEIVHAFVRESGGADVPGWLNEGLAQWLEQRDLARRSAAIRAARAKLAGKELIPLARLKKSLGDRKDDAEIALAYAEALALVDHIERAWGERILFEMVAACRSGRGAEAAFRERAGTDLDAELSELAREL